MTPHRGKHYSLPFLPATPSSPSRTLEGLFELTWRPSWTLDSPRVLLPELQRNKDTVRCAALGMEVPGSRQDQLDANPTVRLLKTNLISLFQIGPLLIIKMQQNWTELVPQTWSKLFSHA